MDGNDPFSRELRSARERIAELQRRSTVDSRPGGGLLPEALAELDGAIEELSVTGQELHEQTVELTATRIALESERERYQALFEFAPVAYLVTDPVARILEANRAAAALLDVDQRFLVGKPLAAYVATGDRWEFRSTVNLLRRADANLVADLPVQFRRRGGGVIGTAAVTVQPVRNREGALQTLRWLLRDLAPSEPKRLVAQGELAVERDDVRKRHLEALAELDPAADLDGTVQVLLDAGVRLLDVDGVGLMLADAQGRLCAAGGSDEASLAFLRAQEHLVKGPCLHAFLLERSIQSGQMGGDPRWPQLREAAAVNGIGAVLATPIALYGGPIGACMLFSSSGIWADGEVLAAEAYASVLAASLDLAGEAQRTTVLSHRLQETLQRHEVVEQAKGALMARHGIGASEASTRLRNLARHSGRPLAEVARSLLRRLGVDP